MNAIKRKNVSTRTYLILFFICAFFPTREIVSDIPHASEVSESMLISIFTVCMIYFCTISTMIVKKKETKKLRLAIIPIITTFLILFHPQDLPYVIAVILLSLLGAVSVIRGPEPVKVSK